MDGLNRKTTGNENSGGEGSPPVEESCIAEGRSGGPGRKGCKFHLLQQ